MCLYEIFRFARKRAIVIIRQIGSSHRVLLKRLSAPTRIIGLHT